MSRRLANEEIRGRTIVFTKRDNGTVEAFTESGNLIAEGYDKKECIANVRQSRRC